MIPRSLLRGSSVKFPTKVVLGEITARDGLQHEEKTISTRAKLWILEQLILAGFKRQEVNNMGSPKGMPQFADADDVFKALHESKGVKDKLKDVELTAVTIREKAADRAIEARKEGWGPNRIPKKATGR